MTAHLTHLTQFALPAKKILLRKGKEKAKSNSAAPLSLVVQDPQPVFDEVRLTEFTGRQWLIDQVDRFRTEQACGFVVIQADPGLGKTTVAARLVQQRGYLSHFTCLGNRSAPAALRNLSAQLIACFALEKYLRSKNAVPSWAHTTEGFSWLLQLAAEKATVSSGQVVLVVDGLDEAEPAEDGLPLGLPRSLPDGVFIITTCRPDTPVPVESLTCTRS